MNETTDSQGIVADELVTDIDDVEAHGLREVAAAASIGAAVIGAGGAAMAASHGGATPVPRTPAIVQQAVDDTQQLASDSTAGARAVAQAAGSDTMALAGHTIADAHTLVDPTLRQVGTDLNNVTTAATNITDAATGYATRTVGATVHSVDSTAGATISATTKTADKVVNDTTKTATHAVDGATSTVGGVEKSALRLVGATEDTLNRGWDLSFDVLGTDISGGGNMLTPSGTVSVTDASGHVLASAKLAHGKCTLHLKAIGQNEAVTIHYGGDKVFRASTIAWQAPVGF